MAAEACHYVLISGLLPDTTAHNFNIIRCCTRLQGTLDDRADHYARTSNDDARAMPYSLFHRSGYTEAVVAFEDRAFAEDFVGIISRDAYVRPSETSSQEFCKWSYHTDVHFFT